VAAVVAMAEKTAEVSAVLVLIWRRTFWAGEVRRTTTLPEVDVTLPHQTPL
jgi:hypothetical protein